MLLKGDVDYPQELVQGSADRLTKLSAKWEEVRGPLVERYRVLRSESEGRESEETRLLGEVARLRSRMKEVADETRQKESLYKQLVSDFSKHFPELATLMYCR